MGAVSAILHRHHKSKSISRYELLYGNGHSVDKKLSVTKLARHNPTSLVNGAHPL